MGLTEIFKPYIGQPEGQELEYRATLVPARSIAQIIAGFANGSGGALIFGIRELPKARIEITGLSDDFNVSAIISKAQRLLDPSPVLEHGYFTYENKRLYGIKVPISREPVRVEGKFYIRAQDQTVDANAVTEPVRKLRFERFATFKTELQNQANNSTSPKKRFLSNYINILNVYEPMLPVLFPSVITDKTENPEGKTLNRLLYASAMDNFELYLSELLHVIYLANPNVLKARDATVKVEDVLRCSDIDEFVQWLAAKKASKLKKGSIKDFLKENHEIKSLGALSEGQIAEIEKALQVRHLYTHRNGVVDDGFLEFFGDAYERNKEHQFSLSEVLDKMEFMVQMVALIDEKAATKFQLSTKEPK